MGRGRAGLTLIELLVALSLVGMLLGFGMVNLRPSRGTASTRAVAELLAEALRQAREEAIKDHAATAVVFPSDGGSKPHSQAYYLLEGAQYPRIKMVRRLDDEFPGVLLFVGHWALSSGTNTDLAPPLAGSRRLDFSAWQPPHPEDRHFIFTPEGEVLTNSGVLFDGAYHIVVCRGAEFGAQAVGGAASFAASKLSQPYTVSLSLLGQVQVSKGVASALGGVATESAAWPLDPAQPPVPSAPGNSNPVISELVVSPHPYPPLLPSGVDATVDLTGYLTIRTNAQDGTGGPLTCSWEVEDGELSSAQETPMLWNGSEWTSTWEWRPPDGAVAGDRYELTCTVQDPAGGSASSTFGVSGVVEVTGIGEVIFDSDRDGSRDIYAMSSDGSNLVNLTNNPAWDHMGSWSPDGQRIAFVSDRLGGYQRIFVMYADGTGVKRVSGANLNNAYLPEWSPDGTRIVYTEKDGSSAVSRTFIVNADGSGTPTMIGTYSPEAFMRNCWHPNGNLLCVNTSDGASGGGFDIFLLDTAGSNLGNLTNTNGFDAMPRWSPDGSTLLWNSDRFGNHEVVIQNFDGTALTGTPQNLSNDPANADLQPTWSPNGQKVLWVKKDANPMSGVGDIWVVNRDGSGLQQLTTHPSLDDFPSWRP